MTRRLRWVWIAPGLLAALSLSCGTAGAADKTKVDQATKRVERGAKQIGHGQVGPGFKEMFTGIGHRPNTEQTLRIGATRDGRLVAIDHQATHGVAMDDANTEPVTLGSSSGYACPNLSARDQQRRLNIPPPGPMRAPGEAQGNFAV